MSRKRTNIYNLLIDKLIYRIRKITINMPSKGILTNFAASIFKNFVTDFAKFEKLV